MAGLVAFIPFRANVKRRDISSFDRVLMLITRGKRP